MVIVLCVNKHGIVFISESLVVLVFMMPSGELIIHLWQGHKTVNFCTLKMPGLFLEA